MADNHCNIKQKVGKDQLLVKMKMTPATMIKIMMIIMTKQMYFFFDFF